jgi:hypothetical protein
MTPSVEELAIFKVPAKFGTILTEPVVTLGNKECVDVALPSILMVEPLRDNG